MGTEKKAERKRKRFAARLKSSKAIICTDIPSCNIVLCNVGQATVLDKDTVHNKVLNSSLTIKPPKFIAVKGESYSFLLFYNIEDAILFYKTFNGKIRVGNGPFWHMNFVENVPNNEIVCSYENPKGLLLINDFITAEEEEKFINMFDWTEDVALGCLKNRLVKHYGYEFRYGSNDVDLSLPLLEKIPQECQILWMKLKQLGIEVSEPNQLTVNKYYPGQGIPSHVDKHSPFESTILALSLGCSVVMDWKHHSGKYVPLEVPARSLLMMQDEARYDWQHGIQPRTYDPIIEHRLAEDGRMHRVITTDTVSRGTRISLTFRWVRSGPCQCSYKTLCDSIYRSTDDIDNKLACDLEDLHVHQVYEQIAGHFSTTRHKPWPKVVEFMRQVPAGSVVYDLGCGNGKNILKRNDILQIAAERSDGLLMECKQHIAGVPAADCVRLDLLTAGLRDGSADVVICIAVIHHFSSRARRLQAISSIARLLRPGGLALITVWAKDQTSSNYLLKNKTPNNSEVRTICGLNLPIHENRTQFQHKDLLVPWKLRSKNENKLSNKTENTLLRYYHVFENEELVDLCKQQPNIDVQNCFYEEGNWCVICKKI